MRKTNKKTLFNITSVLLMTLLLIYLFTTNIYASITPSYYKPASDGDSQKLLSKANKVLGQIQVIGSIVSVITLAIMGIKYMVGSVEEKAEYKKTMLPYVIGAILVFATSNLLVVIYKFGQGLNSN